MLSPTGYPPTHSSRHGPQRTQHTASTAATPRYPQGRRQTPADAPAPLSCRAPSAGPIVHSHYARRMGQLTQRATNYTARSNIEPAQIFLHTNGQSVPRSGGARDVGRGAGSHTPSTASEYSPLHTFTRASSTDSPRSIHLILTQRNR